MNEADIKPAIAIAKIVRRIPSSPSARQSLNV
jgi:hypothetical protein